MGLPCITLPPGRRLESANNQPMKNHLSRPEIQQAMKSGAGRDRRDQTLGHDLLRAMLLTMRYPPQGGRTRDYLVDL